MRRQACTTGAGKAAAHGRAPNLVIHIPISGCVSRCRIGITPILRLGRRDHDRTRIYNRAIQFPTAATSTAACMHACTPQPRAVMAGQGQRWCVVAQRPPSLLRLQQQQPDGGDQAGRPSGTSSSHATSAAGIFFAAMHSMGCGRSCRAPAKHARPRSEWHGPCMPQSGMSETMNERFVYPIPIRFLLIPNNFLSGLDNAYERCQKFYPICMQCQCLRRPRPSS